MNDDLSFEAQWNKLNTLLEFQNAHDNTLIIMALGGLSQDVQRLWWQSDEPFDLHPSPLLQDSLSLYAQRNWQQYRNDSTLFHALNDHVTACFSSQGHCYYDLELHQHYPDLPLLKFWLASASCCCREYPVNQGELWLQHLRLTQAMLLAMEQQSQCPNSFVGYSEQSVIIMDVETQWIVICSNKPFSPFKAWGFQFWHCWYPS
ncbi:hypothetical protein [Vibrio fluvialis]|uniref:hypothetical protein n=1 Tax=Vibrio fluvialis TaxID=676 RepID=UPI00192BF3D7|nr:hypothetical protein [Vibrio fluvialis]MBL4288226.1 hypothetical protein [Vibrio fluvialis]MBL4292576.1 hypothetical protein [Vibrio fluvialis]MBY8176892.1 hypothetical protein [Vibrio fluvialis]MBY8199530.1 hypothetical protein [Vibrio fluvialis]MCE7650003.1 hypothetical protein [Vibrio fluvialis]